MGDEPLPVDSKDENSIIVDMSEKDINNNYSIISGHNNVNVNNNNPDMYSTNQQ